MFTVISRVIHYGWNGFWRNGSLSAATVAIMTLALFVFLGLIFFNVITDGAVASIQNKIDISVYFKSTTSEDEILNIKQSLESLSEVKQVEYVSSDEALQIFKETHKDDPTISQAVQELNTNPLVASLNIKAKQPHQYEAIAEYLKNPNLSRSVDSVSYTKNEIVIRRLTSIIHNVNNVGFGLTIFLVIIAGLVVFNTVRLAIYSNRDEISIMRAVGASNAFVRGPFMVEGVVSGACAALASMVLAAPFMYFVSPYVTTFIPTLNVFQYFYTHIISLFFYQFIFGVVVGTCSSFIAVRRYMRN